VIYIQNVTVDSKVLSKVQYEQLARQVKSCILVCKQITMKSLAA